MSPKVSAQRYRAYFICPGIVSYEESGLGIALIRSEALDKTLSTFVGKPVFGEGHLDFTPAQAFAFAKYEAGDELTQDEVDAIADGIVSAVGREENDEKYRGWYYADMLIWDEATQKKIDEKGFSVSCAHTPLDGTENTEKLRYNGVAYDYEITDLVYEHMAIVPNPRYVDSIIFKNSIEKESAMSVPEKKAPEKKPTEGFFRLFFKKPVINEDDKKPEDDKKSDEEVTETKLNGDSLVEITPSEKVPLADLVKNYEESKKNDDEEGGEEMDPSTEIELPGGGKATLGELIEAYKKKGAHKEPDGDEDGASDKETDEEKKQQLQNSQGGKREKPNANFVKLQNAASKDTLGPRPEDHQVSTPKSRMDIGKERYSSKKE